jgi:uncharacterized protein YehS (DUF1456 family)
VTNNDIFRRLRFIFDFNDSTMMSLFELAGGGATRAEVSDWLKQEDKPDFKEIADSRLALFLNGLIIQRRGKREGAIPEAEQTLNNNIIFRKLKIALDFKDEDILAALASAGFPIGKHELSAFFRKADHKNYRACQSQILRNFLKGLQLKFRADMNDEGDAT